MNTSVRKEVIDSLGGIQDTMKPLEKSLKMHEMRPFDVEPNYYEDLMLSRNPGGFKQANIDMDRQPVSSKKEFLKKTMHDKDFMHSYGKVVSASPYRAVVRRMDYSTMLEEVSEMHTPQPKQSEEDDFEREEEEKSLFNEPHKINQGMFSEILSTTTRPQMENQDEDDLMMQPEEEKADLYGALNSSKMSQNINDDSVMLRQQRDSFLQKFN
jgi:hypothetical protein